MLSGIATYLFGASSDDTFFDRNKLQETHLQMSDDEDWVLVDVTDVEKENLNKGKSSSNVASSIPVKESSQLPDSRTLRSNHSNNTPTAINITNTVSITPTQIPLHPQSNHTVNGNMEESWLVTPPPCFTHPNTFTLEASPFEDILIEHPSISVFSPRPPPTSNEVDPYIMTSSSSSSTSSREINSNDATTAQNNDHQQNCQHIQTTKRDPIRRGHLTEVTNTTTEGIESQTPERSNGSRPGTVTSISATAGLVADIQKWIAPTQIAEESSKGKYRKKSYMKRQNEVAFHVNRHPTRRSKIANRPSGYSNNRKMC